MGALDELPPHTRKCLVAKLVLHDVLRAEVGRAAAGGYSDLLNDARESVERAADGALATPFDPETFQDFLRRLGAEAMPSVSPARRADAHHIATLFEQAVAQHLRAAGEDPVTRVFDAALRAARRLYRQAGVPYEDDVRIRLEAVVDEPPHELPIVDHLVAGEVTQRPSRRDVRIVMSTRGFTPGAMHGLPGVLFHELVVHAFSSRPLAGPGSSSQIFAEGWMDVVSHEAHDAAVRGEAPLDGFAAAFDHMNETVSASRVMHEGRYEPTRRDPFGHAQRQVGRDAAWWVREALCGRASGPCPPAWELALALNRSGLDGPAADELAGAVERARFDDDVADAVELALYDWLGAAERASTPNDRIAAAEAFAEGVLSTLAR